MERMFLQNNWSEMRSRISEWWGDLTDDDLDMIDGDQELLIAVLQERYGYTRNLAFMKVKKLLASYRLEGQGRGNRSHRDLRVFEHPRRNHDDWSESNNWHDFYGSGVKDRVRGSAKQGNK